MKYTTILWDADNTLLDFEYSMKKALQAAFEHFAMADFLDEEKIDAYDKINNSWWKRLELGEVTKGELLNGRFVDFFAKYGIAHISPAEYREVFQVELGKHYAYIPGSKEVCERLRGKVWQYVITNGVTATQHAKLSASGFLNIMDGIFISEQIGVNKPGKGFFDAVFARIPEKDLSKILVVGDSLTSDIQGANNAGVDACWFNPGRKSAVEEYKMVADIPHLEQLFKVLGME
ncbi:MAG: YjjG family noncanonical pyrimidine nucleotidase [Lachnospiraceae bacterium]|nr:YjjG family noncanonical pyrimidine nucleotidase [Lachnospiraceae bacterium]